MTPQDLAERELSACARDFAARYLIRLDQLVPEEPGAALDRLKAAALSYAAAIAATETVRGEAPANPPTANRYHQSLGAKWMAEAIMRSIERRWEDRSFWYPRHAQASESAQQEKACTCRGRRMPARAYLPREHDDDCPFSRQEPTR
jgi:hypothetical protein